MAANMECPLISIDETVVVSERIRVQDVSFTRHALAVALRLLAREKQLL